MTSSILITTYLRPKPLKRCLASLISQMRSPDEIIVVFVEIDSETRSVLQEFRHKFKALIPIGIPPEIRLREAINLGISRTSGDIVCFIDDDAVAHEDWLVRILRYYNDDSVGAVGGRDIMPHYCPTKVSKIGKSQWNGNLLGGHSDISPQAIEVDFLKGVNSSYNARLLEPIDENMIGDICPGYEAYFGLLIRRKGYKIIFDPEILVDHYPVRLKQYSDIEHQRYGNYLNNHNNTYIILKYSNPAKKTIFLMYDFIIGTLSNRGLIYLIYKSIKHRDLTWLSFLPQVYKGKISGVKAYWGNKFN